MAGTPPRAAASGPAPTPFPARAAAAFPPGAEPDSPGSPSEFPAPFPGRRGPLAQIPEDGECEFGAGSGAASGLSRLSSGSTAAALEEVSRCVREMHSFTSELLHWELAGNAGIVGNAGNAAAIPTHPGEVAPSSGESGATVAEDVPDAPEAPEGRSSGAFLRERGAGGTKGEEPEAGNAGGSETLPAEPERSQEPRADPGAAAPGPFPTQPDAPALPELPAALAAWQLVTWRSPRRSLLVLVPSLSLLLAVAALGTVAVASRLLLSLLCVTLGARVGRAALQGLRGRPPGHPFRALLERDPSLSPETLERLLRAALPALAGTLRRLRGLLLVQDLAASLQLALAMWLLTYVGAAVDGLTLLILAELAAFTVPPLYERSKAQLDRVVGLAREQTAALAAALRAKLPGAAKDPE